METVSAVSPICAVALFPENGIPPKPGSASESSASGFHGVSRNPTSEAARCTGGSPR